MTNREDVSLAIKLCEQKRCTDAQVIYHAAADSLVWTDEIPDKLCADLFTQLLMALWDYRTGLLIGQDRPQHIAEWSIMSELAPQWIGFRSDRTAFSEQLAVYYKRSNSQMCRMLKRLP